jgi:hypothetical protein
MWGIPTIQKLNNEAVEAAEIMKRKGYDLPEIKPAEVDPCVHTHIPLGQTPAERKARHLATGGAVDAA